MFELQGTRRSWHFVEARQLKGRGLGWTEIQLLASAVLAKLPFWTVEERLAEVARELGLSVHHRKPRRAIKPRRAEHALNACGR